MIKKVAVPLAKHSPKLGQEASSQTVFRPKSRSRCLTDPTRWGALARNQGGLPLGEETAVKEALQHGTAATASFSLACHLTPLEFGQSHFPSPIDPYLLGSKTQNTAYWKANVER